MHGSPSPFVTIAFNQADAAADPSGGTGGGIYNDAAGTFNFRNTIVAGNYVSGAPIYIECAGTLSAYGANIVGLAGEDPACSIVVASGSVGVLNSSGALGPLQMNGGPTPTHALEVGASAIDAGDPISGCLDGSGALLTDQRGAARVVGVRCDLGAYEYGAVVPEIFADGFESGDTCVWSDQVGGSVCG